MKTTAFAPGKLMVAGEWAVLELGKPCLVMGIKKGVTVTITPSDAVSIEAPDISSDNRLVFARAAIKIASRYLIEQGRLLKLFKLVIRSDISHVGLGSSAAVVVAVIKALFQFHGCKFSQEIIFKLGCVAHYQAQGRIGSCFDVAASTYGGLIAYERFDSVWLEEKLSFCGLVDIVPQDWPHLSVTKLSFPQNITIKTVFSGESADSRELILRMNSFKKLEKRLYDEICDKIARLVRKLVLAIGQQDCDKILFFIKQNRVLLQELSDKSGLDLETPALKKICDDAERQGSAAKFSGAGGGDCAIVVCKTA
ncbi:phosphomevalonate kinase [Candidatus Dependentiae bacterium]|nr:phosphomevalonate kinase [Candidatus Dependentiae bacterium]